MKSAETRLSGAGQRRRRADAGGFRLAPTVMEALLGLLGGQERPGMQPLRQALDSFCEARGLSAPSRATIYKVMADVPVHRYHAADLPAWVQEALYNLDPQAEVPGHQLVFYAFNYGDARAMSYAASLPWLDLYQAARMRGWRPMSLGPLRAAMRRRGI